MLVGPTGHLLLHHNKKHDLPAQSKMDVKKSILPTARESKPSLQQGINRFLVYPLTLSSFLNRHIPFRQLLQIMQKLSHVFGFSVSAIRSYTVVDKLL